MPSSQIPVSPKVTRTYGSKSNASAPSSSAPWSSAGEILYGSRRLKVPQAPTPSSSSRELRRSSRIQQTPRAQTRVSRKRKTPEGDREYNPDVEVDELVPSPPKRPRLATPPAPEVETTIEPSAVPSRSPSPILPPPGTILPNHFPSQILQPPPSVYYGKSVTRVNDRILMKRDLPLSGDLHAFKNQLHQLDDYSPLVKANERLVRESNRRLQNFTDFVCGSCAQLGHNYCHDYGFGFLCEECHTGHRACSKAMPLGTLLDSLEQVEDTAGLSTHGKSFPTYFLLETDKFLSSRNSSRPRQLPSSPPRGSVRN